MFPVSQIFVKFRFSYRNCVNILSQMFSLEPDMHSIRLMVGVAWLICAGAVASAATISARTYECDDLEARLASLESARAALLNEIEIRRCSPSAPSPRSWSRPHPRVVAFLACHVLWPGVWRLKKCPVPA